MISEIDVSGSQSVGGGDRSMCSITSEGSGDMTLRLSLSSFIASRRSSRSALMDSSSAAVSDRGVPPTDEPATEEAVLYKDSGELRLVFITMFAANDSRSVELQFIGEGKKLSVPVGEDLEASCVGESLREEMGSVVDRGFPPREGGRPYIE